MFGKIVKLYVQLDSVCVDYITSVLTVSVDL